MLAAADFTTVYIPAIPSDAAAQLRQSVSHLAIGFDNSPASDAVLAAILAQLFTWDAYRFLTWTLDVSQVQSAIDGIHQFSPTVAHLPGYLWLDAEENGGGQNAPANPPDYFHRAMDYVEAQGITPSDIVKPGIYTRADWWNTYCPGYTEPAQRGWALWTAEPGRGSDPDTAVLYGGWQRSQVQGVQTQEDVATAIGQVDLDLFRPRGGATPFDALSAARQLQALANQLVTGLGG